MLAGFCERSFLKLWSYPNPFKDDGHELCDLLAVFGDYVFIFFDRENLFPQVLDKDSQVLWDRWKRNVVDRQVKTAHGAERYIRSGRPIFLDAKGTTPFPLAIDPQKAIAHKITVDGNGGAHEGTLSKHDADDLLDFTIALLERMYTEPGAMASLMGRQAVGAPGVEGVVDHQAVCKHLVVVFKVERQSFRDCQQAGGFIR